MAAGHGLGFAEAEALKAGDRVRVGGVDCVILDVKHRGRDWPYFQINRGDGVPLTSFQVGGPDWVSWQTCGRPGFPCVVCGADMGWDRPSGVCSERCLRQFQGFPVPAGCDHGS